jgi:uncharacterized integral membrane protein (TIGR00697 family)
VSLPTTDKAARLWFILSAVLLTSAVVAELVSVKLFQVPFYAWLGIDTPFTLTTGALLWPLVFLATDSINEFFGRRAVRFVSWVTIAMIGWTFVITTVSLRIPAASFSPVNADVFRHVFGQSGWIIVGSMTAFLISQLIDVSVFHRIRRALQGRHIWARATGSTIVSQLIDSFVVIWIAFYLPTWFGLPGVGIWDALNISLSSFAYKVGVAIALTPLIYVVHWIVEWWLGAERAEELSREAASHA